MDCLQVLFDHQSLRHFKDEALPQTAVENIKRAVTQTSSACFFQVCTTLRITDRELLIKIGALSGGTMKLAHAPEFWLFCLDFTKLAHAGFIQRSIPFDVFFNGINDCSMACQSALTAAEAQGLGGVAIGGFKRRISEIAQLLKLPHLTAPVLGLVLGVPDEAYREPQQKPRLPQDWLIMDNMWRDPFDEKMFAVYNQEFADYAARRVAGPSHKTWEQACSAMLAKRDATADDLVQYYRSQGFTIG